MTCNEYQELLSAYLDRELPEADQKEVSAHVDRCAACKAEMNALLAIKEQLRSQSLPSIPADLIAQIEAQTILAPRWWEKWSPFAKSVSGDTGLRPSGEGWWVQWGIPTLAIAAALGVWAVLHTHQGLRPGLPATIPIVQRLPTPSEQPRMVAWQLSADTGTKKSLQ